MTYLFILSLRLDIQSFYFYLWNAIDLPPNKAHTKTGFLQWNFQLVLNCIYEGHLGLIG